MSLYILIMQQFKRQFIYKQQQQINNNTQQNRTNSSWSRYQNANKEWPHNQRVYFSVLCAYSLIFLVFWSAPTRPQKWADDTKYNNNNNKNQTYAANSASISLLPICMFPMTFSKININPIISFTSYNKKKLNIVSSTSTCVS